MDLIKIDLKIGGVVLMLFMILVLLFVEFLFFDDVFKEFWEELVFFVLFLGNSCFCKMLWSCLKSCCFVELKVSFSWFSCENRVMLD